MSDNTVAGQTLDYAITAIFIAAMRLKVSELCELAHVTLGSGGSEPEFGNDIVRSNFLFVGHKDKNIDQFLCQRGPGRPFMDHFLRNGVVVMGDIRFQVTAMQLGQAVDKNVYVKLFIPEHNPRADLRLMVKVGTTRVTPLKSQVLSHFHAVAMFFMKTIIGLQQKKHTFAPLYYTVKKQDHHVLDHFHRLHAVEFHRQQSSELKNRQVFQNAAQQRAYRATGC